MENRPLGPPEVRAPEFSDLKASLALGVRDFVSYAGFGLFFASFYVVAGLVMAWITYVTGQTFWLILAVLGFPLIGAFAALGLYETSRRRMEGENLRLGDVIKVVWAHKNGQLPWLAVIIVVIFLFWFFLGHMIFALFLGLSPMTNVSSSLDVFLTSNGLMMMAFGTVVGTIFAVIIFSMSVLGMPMMLDRDVDFMTASLRSISAVMENPVIYLVWGVFIGVVTFVAMVPAFLGLFIVMPILGHATWHLYKRVTLVVEAE